MPYPNNEAEFNEMLQAWAANTGDLKTIFSLTAAQITEVTEMAQLYDYFFQYFIDFEAAVKGTYEVKRAVFRGLKPNQSAPTIPTLTTLAPPATLIFNIEGKARAYRQFFLKNPAYNDALGATLRIADAPEPDQDFDLMQTELDAVGLDNFQIEVSYKRNKMPGVFLEWRVQGDTDADWRFAVNGIGGTTRFTPSPLPTGNQPLTVELRGKNINSKGEPVGIWSQIEVVIAHA